MRLLNTRTLRLAEFFDSEIPEYAILSHRWIGRETTYKDFTAGGPHMKNDKGYLKILSACKFASHYYDFDWIWIDTCCIDKDSSAELSEAVNSMYHWYRRAAMCLAYLHDVTSQPEETGIVPELLKIQLRCSTWFTRGWTLQELLAPCEVLLVNNEWQALGTRSAYAMLISHITQIDHRAFTNELPLRAWSISEKMSWASKRRTSRIEDEAYCLLGLFGINMPLLYGEGQRAFQRLQEEIVRTCEDESIFAWNYSHTIVRSHAPTLFAPSIEWFLHCGNIETISCDDKQPYSITNRGLELDVVLLPSGPQDSGQPTYLIPLNCAVRDKNGERTPLAMKVASCIDRRHVFWRLGCVKMEISGHGSDVVSTPAQQRTLVYIQNLMSEQMTTLSDERPAGMALNSKYDKLLHAAFYQGQIDWRSISPAELFRTIKTLSLVNETADWALRQYEAAWGIDHPNTLQAVNHFGELYACTGRTAEADEFFVRALRGYEGLEGKKHPSTQRVARNLRELRFRVEATESGREHRPLNTASGSQDLTTLKIL